MIMTHLIDGYPRLPEVGYTIKMLKMLSHSSYIWLTIQNSGHLFHFLVTSKKIRTEPHGVL